MGFDFLSVHIENYPIKRVAFTLTVSSPSALSRKTYNCMSCWYLPMFQLQNTSQKVIKRCFWHSPSCFMCSSYVDYVNFRRTRLKIVWNFHFMAEKQESNILHGWRSDLILQCTFYKLDTLIPFTFYAAHKSCSQLFFAASCGIQTWLDLPEILMKTSLSKLFGVSLHPERFAFWKSVKGSNLGEKYTISF